MTKDAEITALHAFVRRLGVDSYCGPWLSSQLVAIEWAIRDDISPEAGGALDINAARAKAAGIIQAAKDEAARISARSVEARDKAEKDLARVVAYTRKLQAVADAMPREFQAVQF